MREELPPETHAEMTPITSISGEIMLLALSSPDGVVTDLELRAIAKFDLRNRLLAIPGVAQISVIGGEACPDGRAIADCHGHPICLPGDESRRPDPAHLAWHRRKRFVG